MHGTEFMHFDTESTAGINFLSPSAFHDIYILYVICNPAIGGAFKFGHPLMRCCDEISLHFQEHTS